MNFPIVIQKAKKIGFAVTVPDLLGCSASGKTLDEAMLNAKEAVDLHLARMIEEGYTIPAPSEIDTLRKNPDFAEGIWGVVSVEIDKLPVRTVRVHISLPEHVLKTLDSYAKKYGRSRSGLLTRAVLEFFARH